jgi:hypothetical protein
MKSFLYFLALATAISIPALSQAPATAPQKSLSPAEQPKNAGSASKDNGGVSGGQTTKPAGAKGKSKTLIGCLSGPDKDGKYELRSMQHRSGVRVLGRDELKNDSGSKVKLTGSWEADPERPQVKEARRFRAMAVEVLSQNCKAPSVTTPVSKAKQREQKQQK